MSALTRKSSASRASPSIPTIRATGRSSTLPLAPRNADGKVEFEADVFILAPKDPAQGQRALFYDVNNRGNKLALGIFNSAPGGNDPSTAADAGDGFLFRRGYTVVWCGWIGELLPGNHRLLLKAPVATDNGKPIRGIVRYEMVTDRRPTPCRCRAGRRPRQLSAHGRRRDRRRPHLADARDRRARADSARAVVAGTPAPFRKDRRRPGRWARSGCVAGGFRPGYLYELVCEARGRSCRDWALPPSAT